MVAACKAVRRRGGDDNMWYVYILQSTKNNKLYIGITSDLRRRFDEHNKGQGGYYTERNRPYKLIFYEAFLEKEDATGQEKFYKSGYGREVLKGKLKKYFSMNKYSGIV
jgi:putative endonuclease